MRFYMPTDVYEGKDCVKLYQKQWTVFGKKAFIITGKHSAKKNESLEDVLSVCKEHQIETVLFDQVEENPSIETVMKARQIGFNEKVDFVIGIGGGSAMDAAKAISLMIAHPQQESSYLYEKKDSSCLPIVCIPTTCGTGSEVTGVSVLTIHDQKTKGSIAHKIFANVALIDGKYLKAASQSVLANTAIDALAHCWESYINSNASDYSRMCVNAGLDVWAKNTDILLKKREASEADYLAMMRASAFAGMAIAQTGTSLPHGLSYPITYNNHIAHGAACGYFLAGYLKQSEDCTYLLKKAGFDSLDQWKDFYHKVCPISPLSIQDLERAEHVLYHNPAKLKNAPFTVTKSILHDIVFEGVSCE